MWDGEAILLYGLHLPNRVDSKLGCWDEACAVFDVCVVQAMISGQKVGRLWGRRWRPTAPCRSLTSQVSGLGARHGLKGGKHGMSACCAGHLGEESCEQGRGRVACDEGERRAVPGRPFGTVFPLCEAHDTRLPPPVHSRGGGAWGLGVGWSRCISSCVGARMSGEGCWDEACCCCVM